MAMAKKRAQQQPPDNDKDWRAGLEEAKRQGKRPDDQKPDYGVQDHTQLMTPSPDPGPEDAGEELKKKQAVPDGLNPQADEEKNRERTRVDPESGLTLLPESVEERHQQSLDTFRRARSAGLEPGAGENQGRAAETEAALAEQWRDNPAMLGVGRNVSEEPVILARATDLPGEGVDLGKRFFEGEYGPPGEGAPPAIPAGPGERHHMGAPWPAPLDPSASAPSPSPEPGPEPSQQWHEPQPIEFADHDAAVRGTLGPDAEQQRQAQEEKLAKEGEATQRKPPFAGPSSEPDIDPSRNSAGKLKHSFVADEMIRCGFSAFGDDPPDHGTLQQALLYAQRRLRANWRQYMAQREEKPEQPAPEPPPEAEQLPAGA
jgi:hypothetical protein